MLALLVQALPYTDVWDVVLIFCLFEMGGGERERGKERERELAPVESHPYAPGG